MHSASDRGRSKGLPLPLPPNRTGESPASGSPVSGFVLLRLSASTHVLLSSSAAHGGQTIGSASGVGQNPARAGFFLVAFPAGCAAFSGHNHPPSETHCA